MGSNLLKREGANVKSDIVRFSKLLYFSVTMDKFTVDTPYFCTLTITETINFPLSKPAKRKKGKIIFKSLKTYMFSLKCSYRRNHEKPGAGLELVHL